MPLPQPVASRPGALTNPLGLASAGLPTHLPQSTDTRTPSPGILLLQGYADSESGSDSEPPEETSSRPPTFFNDEGVDDPKEERREEATLLPETSAKLTASGETEEEIAKWIAERKQRWPSRKRMLEKEQGMITSGQNDTGMAAKRKADPCDPTPPSAVKKSQPQPQPPQPAQFKPCKFFLRNGKCQFGAKCKHKHVSPAELKQVKKTIRGVEVVIPERYSGAVGKHAFFQNLVQKELEVENEKVLDVITALNERGLI